MISYITAYTHIHLLALALPLSFSRIHAHTHSRIHTHIFLSFYLYTYIYILYVNILFNRYTHSHIKYRGKYIDKVLVYRSHAVNSDSAEKTRLSLSLFVFYACIYRSAVHDGSHRPLERKTFRALREWYFSPPFSATTRRGGRNTYRTRSESYSPRNRRRSWTKDPTFFDAFVPSW